MITAPEGFTRAIESGNRDYQMLITCTLASGTVLTIDNTRVWSSGFSYEDSLSTTPDMLEIGTAIINKVTLVINNMDEHYSAYDFGDAVLEVQIGLRPDDDSPISYITKGIYTVDSASYNTMLITLTALDNMYKFDRLYGTVPVMPSTALALVQNACSVCGVTLGVQTFDGANTAVTVPPTADTTYRQMLAWIGQMIGCDWRINTAGELMPVWFNIESLGKFYDGGTFNYNDGAVLNGGTFAYNDGDSVDGGQFNDSGYFVISSLATANVAVDDTVITGVVVRVLNDVTEEEAPTNAFTEYSTGQEGFRVVVENNPEITEGNVQTVLSTLGGRLIGMKYRKGQLMHLSDPRLEAGDVFVYADHKDHAYPMICSQTMFALGQYQTTTSASAVPIRKAAERYGVQAQTTVQIYKSVLREKTSRESAEANLQEQIDNASGLYQTVQSDGQGGSIYLLHNRPTVAESAIVWKMSSTAFGVSTNGGQSYNAGLTADGTAIVQRLYANTITAGILQSPDYAYSSGVYSSAGMLVDLSNKVIRATNFAVTSAGSLYAKSGSIGGFDISGTQLRSDVTVSGVTYSAVMQSMGSSTDTTRGAFYIVRNENGTITNPFLVQYNGKLIATDANITGTITANGGSIGGFDISSTQLRSDVTVSNTTYSAVIQSMGTSTDPTRYAFYTVTNDGTAKNPFYVRYDGYMHSTSGKIGPFTITTDALYYNLFTIGTKVNAIGDAETAVRLTSAYDNSITSVLTSKIAGIQKYAEYRIATGEPLEKYFLELATLDEMTDFTVTPNRHMGRLKLYNVQERTSKTGIDSRGVIISVYDNQNKYLQVEGNLALYGSNVHPMLLLRGTTYNKSTYNSNDNPRIDFHNSDESQNIALIYTDSTSVASAPSLTLVGNQGGEYFIAPNIKIKGGGLTVAHSDSSETSVRLQNNNHDGSFAISSSGSLMLWSVTNQASLIQMSISGAVTARCIDGTNRGIVGSAGTDGYRVSYIEHASATTVRIHGQKGTSGADFSGWTTLTGTSGSDIRLKRNIKPVEVKALPLINSIEMKSFDWIPGQRDYTHQPIGMIADEIEKLDERLVIGGGYDPDGTPNYKVIDDHYMVCYLTKAIQELSAEIDRLKGKKAS